MKPRREIAGVILDRAVKRGEVDRSLDRYLLLDLIWVPVIYRLLIMQAPFEPERAEVEQRLESQKVMERLSQVEFPPAVQVRWERS